jgi:CheY-like chemotaxis protein
MFLRLDGHEVETVYDGPAALTAIAAREPEVVFLDIGMSQMDGYEVARRLRNNGTAAVNRIRLIAVTGYGQEVDRARAEKAGFDAHLVKPADPDAVARILRRSRPDDADPLTP